MGDSEKGGSNMTKWLLAVSTDCADPSREGEFNDWYDRMHLPDVLKTPGFIRANRYVNTDPDSGPGKFLALYEIESQNIDETMTTLRERLAKLREEGRYSDLLVRVSLATYRQISSLTG
jgi:hypothetical protein